jgi:hypothetical protein
MSVVSGSIATSAGAATLQRACAAIIGGLMLVLCASGCAPISGGSSGPAAAPLPPPARVVVEDFALQADALAPDTSGVPMSGDLFRSDPDTTAVLTSARTTAGALARQIVAEMRQRGWPVVRSAEAALGPDDLRVAGEFYIPDNDATQDVLRIALARTPVEVATSVLIIMQRAGQAVVIDQFDARGRTPNLSAIEEPARVLINSATSPMMNETTMMTVAAQRVAPAPEDIRRVARAIAGRLLLLFEKNHWTPPAGAKSSSTSSS